MKKFNAVILFLSISSTAFAAEENISLQVASQKYYDMDRPECGDGRARVAIMSYLADDNSLDLDSCRVVANQMDPVILTASEYICLGYVGVVCKKK